MLFYQGLELLGETEDRKEKVILVLTCIGYYRFTAVQPAPI